MMQFFFQERFL